MATTTTDYTGRKSDLSIFSTLSQAGIPVPTSLGKPFSKAIAGPSKLAQRFLLVLFTPIGSRRSRPSFGTNFLSTFGPGSFPATSGQVAQLFNVQALTAVRYLQSLESDSMPNDERISFVTLTSYNILPTGLQLQASLTTLDGGVSNFPIPVTR